MGMSICKRWDEQTAKSAELESLLKAGFSYQQSWQETYKKKGYMEYILFYNNEEVLRWESEMGIAIHYGSHDMVAIIKKYISDRREQKLTQLGI